MSTVSTRNTMRKCMGIDDKDLKSNDTVSVIVLTYGDYTHLEKTVESVLKQTASVVQIILSDDGSRVPFPLPIVQRLQQETNVDIILRQGKENVGTVMHMNETAALCFGKYIKFIASGDMFAEKDSLMALVAFADIQNALAVTSHEYVVSKDLKKIYYVFPGKRGKNTLSKVGTELFCGLAKKNFVSASGTLYQRRFFTEFGGFHETYRLLEDWPTWLWLSRSGKAIPLLDKVTCLHSIGGNSSSCGDAHGSEALHSDMKICYEIEILPYRQLLSAGTWKQICFDYDRLQNISDLVLWKRYFFKQTFIKMKHMIKKVVFSR